MALLPDFDPADFRPRAAIDNRYFPHPVNRLASYDEVSTDPETGEVSTARADKLTTSATARIAGVTATVIRETEFEDGLLVEDTLDFFAQDRDGNVWYLGEDTYDFEYADDGTFVGVDDSGSWRAGEPGVEPGWLMQAEPAFGAAYYKEVAPGISEDESLVIGLGETLRTELGRFRDVVRIVETSALEPEEFEVHYFAPGVGRIAEHGLLPDGTVEDVAELVRVADVTRRDCDDGDDRAVALVSLAEGKAVRRPEEVDDLDPDDFAGGGARHVTLLRADAGAANALGAYVYDARTGVIGDARILVEDLSAAAVGTSVAPDAPGGKVVGLFLVADTETLGLDLGAYADGGLRLVNPLTGERANIGDALAPFVTDAEGSILPVQPLNALGADDGTNYLNPSAGLHAIGISARALQGSATRLIGFEDGAAADPERDGDFNDAIVAIGHGPLGADLLDRLERRIDDGPTPAVGPYHDFLLG